MTNWVTIEGPGGESWARLTNTLEWVRAISDKYVETMWQIAWSYLATLWIVIVIVVSITFVGKRSCEYQKTWEKWLQVCSERRRWPIAALPVVKSITDTEDVKWFFPDIFAKNNFTQEKCIDRDNFALPVVKKKIDQMLSVLRKTCCFVCKIPCKP